MGVVPPLDAQSWQAEFDAYKETPQYRGLNEGMTLNQFKTIYWWEWTHRVLARLIGVVFLLPFLWFLWRGYVEPGLRARLWSIFGLGALQGAVGWWMVASGLVGNRINVSQYRLAFHLTLASAIYAYILWTAQQLAPRSDTVVPARVRIGAIVVLVLTLLQIYLGALVAGLHAGLAYNTWPLIDGSFIPQAAHLFFSQPLWRNFFENILTVQFDHRMVAYALWFCAVLHAADAVLSRQGRVGALTVAVAVTVQATLGILTLLNFVPLPLALTHQAMAIVVLTLATIHAQRLSPVVATVRAKAASSALQPRSVDGIGS